MKADEAAKLLESSSAAERIHAHNQSTEKLLWWWRIPFLGILAVAAALLWFKMGGFAGAFVGSLIVAFGIWVARQNPWKRPTG